MIRAGFAIDLERCTGCSACRVACRTENELGARSWRKVRTFNAERRPGTVVHHLSLACNHCADAPCMRGCPARAYHRDPTTDAVILDPGKCMGCRYCAWVCPYGAPVFDEQRGVMEKCTFCVHRTAEGELPACVEACPVDALGVLTGPPSTDRIQGLPSTGIGPALAVRPRRSGGPPPPPPATCAPPPPAAPPAPGFALDRARAEWSLLVFTLTAMALITWQVAAMVGGPAVVAPWFVVTGIAAMSVSLLHLGNPRNAWRAGLNLATSWVSREIVAFSTFFGLVAVTVVLGIDHAGVGWAAAAFGLLALLSMDMVYAVPGQAVAAVPHSAMVSVTAVLGVGVLAGIPLLIGAALVLKTGLYLARVALVAPPPPALLLLRLGCGVGAPLAMWGAGVPWGHAAIIAALVVGEAVDRVQFYGELSFLSPELQIERDLRRAAAEGPELPDWADPTPVLSNLTLGGRP